ncbi:hypothetical protein LSTR_LSTR017528 [Laodelphax striatellus]|uniref:Uncharacterized protein n=1 Tax=Laodelphax striatellus TaxID=195883 RepID=A0A482XT97_LAOST|nr:hypothetical protein LSTR_LSTR017528 [Laodelphax striatellus]
MNPDQQQAAMASNSLPAHSQAEVCLSTQQRDEQAAAVNAVTLSNVAKYWVLTQTLFPGGQVRTLPCPTLPVSVYGLPRLESVKDPMTSVCVAGDTVTLVQHQSQIPVNTITVPVSSSALPALTPAPHIVAVPPALTSSKEDKSSAADQCNGAGQQQVHCQVQCDMPILQQQLTSSSPATSTTQSSAVQSHAQAPAHRLAISFTPQQRQQLHEQVPNCSVTSHLSTLIGFMGSSEMVQCNALNTQKM